jgi:hypothetical protein
MLSILFGRRSISFLLFGVAMGVGCYNLAWDPELRDKLTNWSAFGWLALVLVGLVVLIYATIKHNRASATLGAIIGIVAAVWGQDVLDGIDLENILLMLGVLVIIAVLYCANVLDWRPNVPSVRVNRSNRPTVVDSRAS